MTDGPFEPTDLAPAGDDELEFDDFVPATPPKKSRRTPARGSDTAAGTQAPAAELPPSAAPERAATEEPADPPAPFPLSGDAPVGSTTPGSTSSETSPRDRNRMILLAIVGLALFTSLMSLGGLIAVSRTLAAAQAQRAQAQGERAELAKLPEMIAALDQASARLATAAARTEPAASVPSPATTKPLTTDDLNHGLDTLRLALDNHQPAGANAIGDTLHSGFAEIGTRLDRIEAQLARPAPARAIAPRPLPSR